MKNKKVTYGLIGVVVIVWGLVIYRFVSGFNPEDTFDEQVVFQQNTNVVQLQRDTFELIANYPDPFLGKQRRSIKPSNKAHKVVAAAQKIIKKPPPPKKKWPAIDYGGVIKNQSSAEMIALVNINGKKNLMREGDIVLDVELKTLAKDSALMAYAGEQKWLRK